MAIRYTTAVEGDMLRVCASGFDETLDQVRAYAMAIIEAALAHGAVRDDGCACAPLGSGERSDAPA